MSLIFCSECKREVSSNATACPNCGSPILSTKNVSSKKILSKKSIAVVSVILFVLLISILGVSFYIKQEKIKDYNSYVDKLNSFSEAIISSGSEAESLGNLVHSVWSDSINKKKRDDTAKYVISSQTKYNTNYNDFNTSLSLLFNDSAIKTKVQKLKDDQGNISDMIKELQNPVQDFNTCYTSALSVYTYYESLVGLVSSPTGSYATYTESFTDIDNNLGTALKVFKSQIPEKK